MRKDFNKEISKWNVYYLEERFDDAGNRLTPHIKHAYWISSVRDYDHYSFELHHVIPFTDWENNTKNVREKIGKNVLILLPKVMHQHLENPIYRLSKADFEKVYKIHPDAILYDINSKAERVRDLFIHSRPPIIFRGQEQNSPTIESCPPFSFENVDLSCFDSLYKEKAV